MSDALKLALTITATDMAGGVLKRFRDRLVGTGEATKQVRKDFDQMINHFQKGVKGLAVGKYLGDKLKPGVAAAADLQTSMLDISRLLWDSHKGAGALNAELARMRSNAIDVSSRLPYSATDVANIQANLLQGGVSQKAILGKKGAAFSTAALAAVYHLDPASVAEDVAKIGHGFQLRGGEYGQLANSMAQISGKSPAILGELLYNMKRAAPGAHSLGISPRTTGLALADVSTLGAEAGSDLNQFFMRLSGASRHGRKALIESGINVYNKQGHFIGFEKMLAELRQHFKGMSQERRMIQVGRIFGSQGSYVANLLLNTGNKSYDQIKEMSQHAATLQKQEQIWAKGLNANVQMLQGTSQSTLANIFQPMLPPLTKAVSLSNQLVSNIGALAGKHQTVAKGLGYGAAGLAALAGGYGLFHLIKGGAKGLKVMRGLKGLGGIAGGVATGEALKAAAGVTPVYVVNMPSGGLGGAGVAGETVAAEKGAAGMASRLKRLRQLTKSGPAVGELAGGGVVGAAKLAGGVVAAGTAGYALGTMINKGLLQDKNGKDTSVGRDIGEGVAHVMAWFGDHSAQEALQTHMHHTSEVHLKMEVESKDGSKVRVKSMTSKNAKAQLDTGPALMGGM